MIRLLSLAAALAVAAAATPARAVWIPKTAVVSEAELDRVLHSMTTEEKVGQLLMVGFGGTRVSREAVRWLSERHVGGVALFSRNIKDLEQTARFARELHALTDGHIPTFLALDQEGGNVVLVKEGATLLPGNMALGATRSPTLAYVAGQALAIDLKMLGFNMNLAPVLDVNSNPANPVIGIRSYGERPELVASLGAWYVRGQQEMGVVAVAKHFPGHGDTQSDSHYSMPAINTDLTRLNELELLPFREAIDAGLDAVMTAHIALPQITGDRELPATLSKVLLTHTLRRAMGFQGVVITDGLEMQGIVRRYGSGRAAVLAILAGADMPMILWTPKVKEEVYQELLGAMRSGEITMARLDESVRRILRVKARRGLFARRMERIENVLVGGNRNPVHDQVAMRIAREAVTLVRNHGDVLPVRGVRYRKVVAMAPPGAFGRRLAATSHVQLVSVPYVPSRERRRALSAEVVAAAADADLLVVGVVNRYHLEMLQGIVAQLPHLPVALVSFASPYYLSSVPEVDAYLCTYSYLDVAQAAAAEAVLGEFEMTGRLPISIPGFYAYGHRVEDRMARLDSAPPTVAAVR